MSTCSICGHDQIMAINDALMNETPYRIIAEKYKVSPSSLSRHMNTCLLRKGLREAGGNVPERSKGPQTPISLVNELRALKDALLVELQAVGRGGRRLPLTIVRELRNTIDLCIKSEVAMESRRAEGGGDRVGRVIYDCKPTCCPRYDERCQSCSDYEFFKGWDERAKQGMALRARVEAPVDSPPVEDTTSNQVVLEPTVKPHRIPFGEWAAQTLRESEEDDGD